MSHKNFAICLIVIILQLLQLTQGCMRQFGYKTKGDDWPGICQTGKQQSPIDIIDKQTTCNRELDMEVMIHNKQYLNVKRQYPVFGDNPNYVQNIQADLHFSDLTFTLSDKIFEAVQFHLHAPAEHSINGKFYDAEMHIVHSHGQGDNTELAVLGIFFDINTQPNSEEETFFHPSRFDITQFGENPTPIQEFNPFNAFGDLYDRDSKFYYYKGSLTTPPCSEMVNWFLKSEPLPITKSQLETIQNYFQNNDQFSEGTGNGNNRKIQKLNSRTVEYGGVICEEHEHRQIEL